MEDPINYCTKKCKRWPSKLCSVSYQKKDISSLKRSSLFLAYLSEILMHQKPILIKHSRDPIIGKKPLSSMCCLWQPITAASDHLKWHLTGNICIFFTSWWDQTEEAPRDCVSKLPRAFSGWSHIWTCWDLKMTLRRKGERSVDSLHSDVVMEVFRSDEYQRSSFKVLV